MQRRSGVLFRAGRGRLPAAALALAMVLALCPLAAPAWADPFIDAQVTGGSAYFTNGYVEVGSRDNGSFGASTAPSGYHPLSTGGPRIGFRADRDKDGWGVGTDDGDFFTPGSPYEGWAIQVGDGGTARWNSNVATGVPGSHGSPTTSGGAAGETWTSSAPVDGVSVEQVATAPAGALYMDVDVTLTNTTGSPLTDLYYGRGLDPDNCKMRTDPVCDSDGDNVADSTGVYDTHNTVVAQRGAGDARSIVSATQTDGSYLDLRTPEANSVVGTGTAGDFCTTPGLAGFFSDPVAVSQGGGNCSISTDKGTSVFQDDTFFLVIKVPTLDAGASRTLRFSYYLSAAAAAASLSSTGAGTEAQHATVTVPSGGSVTLLDDDGNPATAVTRDGQGTYTLDTDTGEITFTPVLGFVGNPDPVDYRVTTTNGTSDGQYAPTVTAPPPPTPPDTTSSGAGGTRQSTHLPVPPGGSVTLLDGGSNPVTSLTVPGAGTYQLNVSTGVVTFTPLSGYKGTPPAVTYQVTDAYGQSATGTWTVTVGAPARPRAWLSAANPSVVGASRRVLATCAISGGTPRHCTVKLTARVGGRVVVLGTGRAAGSHRSIRVQVTLTGLGGRLATAAGGVATTAIGYLTVAGQPRSLLARKRFTVVARLAVAPRPVFFATGSARLRAADRRYLDGLRRRMGRPHGLVCDGYTDATSSSRYNSLLALARAGGACEYLARGRHIRITLYSHGEAHPFASNATAAGRALNRRAVIRLRY